MPRCALKPFSLNGLGSAINLFNISRTRSISNAAIKGQCARDYLYGKEDLTGENLLAKLEGRYASIVSLLIGDEEPIAADKEWLLLFAMIQHRRTEMAIKQYREAMASMAAAIYARDPSLAPKDTRSDSQIMRESIAMAVASMPYIKDLKVIILSNRTAVDLAICDHPSVLTNRYHFQKLQQKNFGLGNSGALMSMPLSPRMSMMAYDGGVYTIPNATGSSFVEIQRDADVTALNQLQYLNAAENIYFRNWTDAKRIAIEVSALSEARKAAGPVTTTLVRDYGKASAREIYRTGTVEEQLTAKETVVMLNIRQPLPPTWPSVLKFRTRPTTYHNGTAVGHVRKREWLTGGLRNRGQ